MTHEERLNKIREIEKLSPLEMSKNLMDIEMYDLKSSQKILDEVHKSFESKDNIIDEVLFPCMFTVADGLFTRMGSKSKGAKNAGKKGLTPGRFAREVKDFSYDSEISSGSGNTLLDNYITEENLKDLARRSNIENNRKYNRDSIEDKDAMNSYKDEYFANDNDKGVKSRNDVYNPNQVIYKNKENTDNRFNEKNKVKQKSNTDHVISAEHSFERYKTNVALSDSDIQDITNINENFKMTSNGINNAKKHLSASELKKLKADGEFTENREEYLTDEILDNIERAEISAQKSMDKHGSKIIGNKLLFNSKLTRAEERKIKKIKDEGEKTKVLKELRQKKARDSAKVYNQLGTEALNHQKEQALGDITMIMVTPITYEVYDSFKNGVAKGVNESGSVEGIKVRVERVIKYVIKQAKKMVLGVGDVLKAILGKIVQGVVNLFLGVYKFIGKVIYQGMKSLLEAYKVCFGKESGNMSSAEKGDAIVKVIGSLITTSLGFLIEDFIDNYLPEEWSIPISMIITGVLTTVVTYSLNKMDLFSVKAEKRYNAVKELFDKRIAEIKEAVELFDEKAIETLKKQQCLHSSIASNLGLAFENDDIDMINENISELAEFFDVKLEYSSTKEFIDYFDAAEKIAI